MHEKILSMNGKISAMDEIIISMDKNVIHGSKCYPWIKVSSMEKIMDNFFICGCHPLMKSTNKGD